MNRIDTSTDTQKLMAASLPAVAITFILFALMQQLIGTDTVAVQPKFIALDDELPEPRKDCQANFIVRVSPAPPKTMPPPESVPPEADDYGGQAPHMRSVKKKGSRQSFYFLNYLPF